MADNNTNTNQQSTGAQTEGNQAQQNTTNTQQTNTGAQAQNNQQNTQQVDTGAIKSEAISALLKSFGVESEDALKGIVDDYNKRQNEGKTELQKATEQNGTLLKELAEERDARMISDAKVAAIQMGAIPDMIDDLVVVAKSKVTKEKDITKVITEIKDSPTGKAYFKSEEDEGNKGGKPNPKTGANATRGNVTNTGVQNKGQNGQNNQNNNSSGEDNNKYAGTYAERIFKNRQRMSGKSHYFNN